MRSYRHNRFRKLLVRYEEKAENYLGLVTSIMLLNCISEDNFECLSVTSDLNIDLNYLRNKIQKTEEAIRSNSRSTCSVIAFVLTMKRSNIRMGNCVPFPNTN